MKNRILYNRVQIIQSKKLEADMYVLLFRDSYNKTLKIQKRKSASSSINNDLRLCQTQYICDVICQMCLFKRMMKEMNEESAEQREEVLKIARRVQQRCARFKLDIAS